MLFCGLFNKSKYMYKYYNVFDLLQKPWLMQLLWIFGVFGWQRGSWSSAAVCLECSFNKSSGSWSSSYWRSSGKLVGKVEAMKTRLQSMVMEIHVWIRHVWLNDSGFQICHCPDCMFELKVETIQMFLKSSFKQFCVLYFEVCHFFQISVVFSI